MRCSGDSRLHARGRCPESRARDRRALPEGGAPPGRGPRRRRSTVTPELVVGVARRAAIPRRGDGGAHEESGRGDRPRLDAGRRRRAIHRGLADGRPGSFDAHRLARRRDEGVRARGALLDPRARERSSTSIPTSTSRRRSTCTCPRARSRKTGHLPASRWPRRSCRS